MAPRGIGSWDYGVRGLIRRPKKGIPLCQGHWGLGAMGGVGGADGAWGPGTIDPEARSYGTMNPEPWVHRMPNFCRERCGGGGAVARWRVEEMPNFCREWCGAAVARWRVGGDAELLPRAARCGGAMRWRCGAVAARCGGGARQCDAKTLN